MDGWTGGSDWRTTLSGNCGLDVFECASSPCQNGGTCTDSMVVSSVSLPASLCTCVAGFANGVCEYDFISEYTAECTVMESDDNSGAEVLMSGWGEAERRAADGVDLGGRRSRKQDIDVSEWASSTCHNGATCKE